MQFEETDDICQAGSERQQPPSRRRGRGDVYHSVEQRKWPVLDCGELDMPGGGGQPRGSQSSPSVQTRQGWRTGGRYLMI